MRNVFASLVLGSVVCIAIYLPANVAYLRVLAFAEIAASDHVGATVAEGCSARAAAAWPR
jgi:hypothetical protein